MCLTIPKQVLAVNTGLVRVKTVGDKFSQKLKTIIKVKKGDWVLTQGGVIVSKITARQAKEINKLIHNS